MWKIKNFFPSHILREINFQAWLSLLDNAMLEVEIMSQWAIDGVGRSGDIFNHMKKAIEKNVKMNILFNTHADADMDTGFSPYDLMKSQKYLEQVSIPQCGKTEKLLLLKTLIF